MTISSTDQRTSRSTPVLVGVSLAYFMVLLDTTVLAVAEPDLISSLHTDVVGVGWATTAYTMALAAALVLGGSLADRLGANRVFAIGTAGFGIVSLGCALSPGLGVLVASRAVLGLLAAAIIPSSLALIVTLYPQPRDRARAVSTWAAISGSAMATGPVLGGWLVELYGWRSVFVINVPLAVVVLLLGGNRVAVVRHARVISPAPHLGLVVTLALLTLAITEAGGLSWGLAVTCALAAVVLAWCTAIVDRRSTAPLVPPALRRNRPVWTAFVWGAVVNYAVTSVLFSVPLILHATPFATGITLLPMTVLVAVNPLVTGRLVARYGPLLPIRLGFAAFTIGLGITAVALAGDQQAVAVGAGLLACGLGISWTLPALVGYAISNTGAGAAGAVGGILNATRQIGATIGAATASATLAAHSGGVRASAPLAVAAVLCLLGLVSSLASRRRGSS